MASPREAARAVATHSRRAVGYHARLVELAIVRSVGPGKLSAELTTARLRLEDDQLLLGYTARKYDQDLGIEVGDTLVLVEVPGDDWVVLDVIAEPEVSRGIGTQVQGSGPLVLTAPDGGGTVTTTGGHQIVAKEPHYDVDGDVDGWIAVYNHLPA